MKPLCVDLFCGLGGWAEGFLREGYRVVGFDNDPRFAKVYPGEFVLQDIRTLDGRRFRNARCIVASPPCQHYTKLDLPASWGARWREDDGGRLWDEAERVQRESGAPMVIENVRGAQRERGRAVCHVGSRYLWGDVPLIDPEPVWGKWRLPPSPDRTALRAKIPLPIARAVARGFL